MLMKSRVSGYKMAHAKKPHARLGGRRAQRKGGMTVQNIKRFVEHAKMDHEERLQDIRIQMKSLPPGDLIFARKNQKYYCVQKLNDQRFGITRDQQLVQGLALKRYLQEERDALQDNLKILDKVLKDCQNTSFDDIMQSLPPGFRQLPREYYRLKKKKKTYCKNPYYPEHLIYRTNGGELVRSKSEQSIGNALEDYGIEYTYDEGIIVGTRCYYADFVITCRDGTQIIWEHFGFIDSDKNYREHALQRMKDYRERGCYQWKNLIYTFEEDVRSLEIIRQIIEEFVLPRYW